MIIFCMIIRRFIGFYILYKFNTKSQSAKDVYYQILISIFFIKGFNFFNFIQFVDQTMICQEKLRSANNFTAALYY